MSNYAVMKLGAVATRSVMAGEPAEWTTPDTAWWRIHTVLTWETEDGAQRFADMNGGVVTPFTVVFRGVGILQAHGPVQHSPDED